jgi:hypothetical protein
MPYSMLAKIAAVLFGLALLFQIIGFSAEFINASTLTTAGLLFVALHLGGMGTGAAWRPRRGRR